jgi:hypothetical protein
MSRYKYTKLSNLGPVHGFLIHTPDDRKLKDVYPQFIVRELNRMADRINKLEREVEALRLYGNKDCTAQADEALKEVKL